MSERIHELKTVEPYWSAIVNGSKTFELRRNDRGFKVGDVLWLRRWDAQRGFGPSIHKRVVYMLDSAEMVVPPESYGLVDGFVVLGIGPVSWPLSPVEAAGIASAIAATEGRQG